MSIDLVALEIPHPDPFVMHVHVEKTNLSSVIAHVDNIQYVTWLDRAAVLHADSLGMTRAWLKQTDRMWFVARHEIDYLAEAWLADDVQVLTWIRSVHKVKSWRDYVIYRESDDTILCRASSLWVFVDLQSRRPIRIPPDACARFDPVEGHVSDSRA